MGSELLAAVLALIGFVLTQGFLKFVLEPIQEQRRAIGEIAHLLNTLVDIPDYREDVDREEMEELRREARKTMRALAGRLWTSLWAIPLYDVFALSGLVPKANHMRRAAMELTIWSYFMSSAVDVNTFRNVSTNIKKLLGIKGEGLPIMFDHDPDAGVPIDPEHPD
jgi:hypothetical protein